MYNMMIKALSKLKTKYEHYYYNPWFKKVYVSELLYLVLSYFKLCFDTVTTHYEARAYQ